MKQIPNCCNSPSMGWQHRLSNANTMQVVKVISLKLSKVVMLLLLLLLLLCSWVALLSHYQVETSATEVWAFGWATIVAKKSENYAIFGIWERPASAIYIHKYLLAKFEIAAECYHLSNFKNTFNRYIYQNQIFYQNLNILDGKWFFSLVFPFINL